MFAAGWNVVRNAFSSQVFTAKRYFSMTDRAWASGRLRRAGEKERRHIEALALRAFAEKQIDDFAGTDHRHGRISLLQRHLLIRRSRRDRWLRIDRPGSSCCCASAALKAGDRQNTKVLFSNC